MSCFNVGYASFYGIFLLSIVIPFIIYQRYNLTYETQPSKSVRCDVRNGKHHRECDNASSTTGFGEMKPHLWFVPLVGKARKTHIEPPLLGNDVKDGHKTKGLNISIAMETHVQYTRSFPTKARRTSCSNCFHYDYKSLIKPKNLCPKGKNISLFILITSIASNTALRNAVRETWGSISMVNTSISKGNTIKYLFLFGKSRDNTSQNTLRQEGEQYNDIFQANFVENYYNLSVKVLMGLQWIIKECPTTEFILRTADDMYNNLRAIVYYLKKTERHMEKRVMGDCRRKGSPPIRDMNSRVYISPLEYPITHNYPPYCVGTSFVLTIKNAKAFIRESRNIPFFPLEDVYFGMVMKKLGLRVYNRRGFSLPFRFGNDCRAYLAIHYMTPKIMRHIWQFCSDMLKKQYNL